jgi:hypothetical protein
MKIDLNSVYVPSENVVAREIEGELVIVPLVSGIGDMEDDIFALNETGKAIWDRLDGKRSLKDLVEDLSNTFEATPGEIEQDVVGLMEELFKRRMVVEAEGG